MTTLAAGTRLGAYEILALAGAGGMGQVYRACDTRLDRIVALKVLPGDLAADAVRRERFEREARAVSALNHPNICTLHDIGRENGVEFLVMEYCDGETLAEHLAKRPLRFEQVLRFAIEIAEAVDAAHSRGLTHRDLKPANIMLTAGGVKLLDFGLATWRAEIATEPSYPTLPEQDVKEGLTADGAVVGTLNYMAPEQIEGRSVDERADIFALGAILYEMTTRRRAFDGDSRSNVAAAILEHDPPPMSSLHLAHTVPPAFERLVLKCLAKSADERWQTARDLASELKWIAETSVSRPEASPERPRRRRRSFRMVASLLSVGAVLMLAIVIPSARRNETTPRPVRFEISPPAGISLSPSASVLAVSPDGRQIAFLAASPAGPRRIWIRSLDSLTAREVPGTEEALGPFWSPDSRYLAFFVGNQLKKIDINGGPPQTICDDTGNQSASWSRDGVILFTAKGDSELRRVSASGGVPEPVTRLDEARGETGHKLPDFLPDGRHFLFVVRTALHNRAEIQLGSLDSGQRTLLLRADSQAAYAQPGRLLFIRDGTLLSQPFDPVKLRLTGEPVAVAGQVGINSATPRGMFSVSSDNVLVYRRAPTAELARYDRRGNRLEAIESEGFYRGLTLSSDGKLVAFSRVDPQGRTRNIWVVNLASRISAPVTFQKTWDVSPVWSPDGRRIAFASEREGQRRIYDKASSGAGEEELVVDLSKYRQGTGAYSWRSEGSLAELSDWSRDGRFMLYATRGDLWVFALADRMVWPFLQTEFRERQGRFSADGRWIAYVSDESGRDEVYVRPFPHGDGKWKISIRGGIEPRWRADGKEIFYIAPDQKLMAVPVTSDRAFQMNAPTVLFLTRAEGSGNVGIVGSSQYVTAPDGTFLISQTADGESGPITVIVNWAGTLPH